MADSAYDRAGSLFARKCGPHSHVAARGMIDRGRHIVGSCILTEHFAYVTRRLGWMPSGGQHDPSDLKRIARECAIAPELLRRLG